MTDQTTNVRIPTSLVDKIRVIATAHERSVAAELRVALNQYIRQEAEEPA